MGRKKNHLGWNFKREKGEDKLSPKDRSNLMSKIRSQGTKFENEFTEIIKKRAKKKFDRNAKDIMGKPDMVFRKARVCVFFDSDFWHGWQFPRWKHLLKNDYWQKKIERHRNRDSKVTTTLRKQGWTVIRLWGHDVKGKQLEAKLNRLIECLK